MNNPSLKTALSIVALDNKIKELQEKKNKLKKDLFTKFGQASFCYELKEPINNNNFLRIKITDNLEKLQKALEILGERNQGGNSYGS